MSPDKIATIGYLLQMIEVWDKAARKARRAVEDTTPDAKMICIWLRIGRQSFELPFWREAVVALLETGRNNLKLWARDLREELR